MTDRRLLRFNGRVAHASLKGKVDAAVFTVGRTHVFDRVVTDLFDKPDGARQCQMVRGEAFVILEEKARHVFGFREKDGYVGWVLSDFSTPPLQPTHRVCVPRAVALENPDVTNGGHEQFLPFGAGVEYWPRPGPDREEAVRSAGWIRVKQPGHSMAPKFIRDTQLAELGWVGSDPAAIAEGFLATPYIYGGDTGFGIDCSGLIQVAFQSCGLSCPRDSDMQSEFFRPISKPELRRGDLVFWKGHVGMMLDQDTLLHSNAYHMAVAKEPLEDAITRIGQKEFGAVTGYARHPDA